MRTRSWHPPAPQGLRLEYRPELLVHHHHPQTLDGYAGGWR